MRALLFVALGSALGGGVRHWLSGAVAARVGETFPWGTLQVNVVGTVNDAAVKLVKLKGAFVWHHHAHEDELFLVVRGRLLMQLRDREVWIEEGEFLIVPHGVEHRPVAPEEVQFGWDAGVGVALVFLALFRMIVLGFVGVGLTIVPAAFLALPVILGASAVAWLLSKSYITPEALLGYTRQSLVEGLQGIGSTVLAAVVQTDLAAWVVANVGTLISTTGVTGLSVILAGAGASTVLSSWVLYRNLLRSRSRESDYELFSL